MSGDDRPRDFVQSLERGLAVITAFGHGRREKTLTEVAKIAGLTRAGARRLLITLEHLGHVRSDGKYFSLAPKVLDLGFAYLSSQPWWQSAEPFMEQVVNELGESCSAAVLDGTDIVYVAYATSLGRVLLAAEDPAQARAALEASDRRALTSKTVTEIEALLAILARVREQGFAIVNQELETGLRSVSVPLVSRSGQTVAAMNVSVHASRADITTIESRFVPVLKAAAARISNAMTF